MTHHENDTPIAQVMEPLINNGMASMGEAFGALQQNLWVASGSGSFPSV